MSLLTLMTRTERATGCLSVVLFATLQAIPVHSQHLVKLMQTCGWVSRAMICRRPDPDVHANVCTETASSHIDAGPESAET